MGNRYKFAPVGQSANGFFKEQNIKYVSAGESHAAAVDAYGNAWTWGKNSDGQCGVQGAASIVSPPQMVSLQVHIAATHNKEQSVKRDKAIMVACGGQHTLFLSHENDVFAVGNNAQGQLGISSNEYDH